MSKHVADSDTSSSLNRTIIKFDINRQLIGLKSLIGSLTIDSIGFIVFDKTCNVSQPQPINESEIIIINEEEEKET